MNEIENNIDNLNLEAGDSEVETRVNTVSSMATTFSEAFASINTVGYKGPLLNETEFASALSSGPKSIEFTKLISFLTNEIRVLCNLDECVNPINVPEDSASFIMEICSFMKELGCPYPWLMEGHISERFSTEPTKLLLVEFLCFEVMIARIHKEKNPGKKIELKLRESPQAADLRKILQTLGFSKPPPNITMKTLMQKTVQNLKAAVEKAGPDLLGHPILNATLNEKQWEKLSKVQEDLDDDFCIRREMLLKRLDCTIQSFQWSNKTKGKEDLIDQLYTERRKHLKNEPNIDISDLLAAREDLAIIQKTSSASVRKNTKSAINSVIIGQVPDRGGRTSEQAPPPPEMPPWQQRSAGPSRGGSLREARERYFSGGRGSSFSSGGRDNSFNKGGDFNSARGSFDSAGSYDNNYSKGGGGPSGMSVNNPYYKGNASNSYYSRGGRGGYTSREGGGHTSREGGGHTSREGGGHTSRDSGYTGGYDSAGSYGGYSQEPKRPKTFDHYQPNRTSYADQYVQENNQNEQYRPRSDNRGGRSNYNRGGGSGYR